MTRTMKRFYDNISRLFIVVLIATIFSFASFLLSTNNATAADQKIFGIRVIIPDSPGNVVTIQWHTTFNSSTRVEYGSIPGSYINSKEKPGAFEEKHPVHVTLITPPASVKTVEPKRQTILVKMHNEEQQRVLSSPLNKSLVKFNALSQTLCDMIALKKFTEAEQQYPSLYKLALDIYPQVSSENQPRLLRVVTSLHEQLQDVRKAYAVAQDVKDVYQKDLAKETPVQVWKPATLALPKEQVHHLDQELTRLRHMLEHTKPSDVAKHSKLRFWH